MTENAYFQERRNRNQAGSIAGPSSGRGKIKFIMKITTIQEKRILKVVGFEGCGFGGDFLFVGLFFFLNYVL